MTRIRAKCPSCGDVEFGIESIVVLLGPDGVSGVDGVIEDAYGAADRSYRFSCPSCDTSVRRSAVPDVIELLITAGVRVEHTKAPRKGKAAKPLASVPEASTPRLTDADVDAFREFLARPDWFDKLKALDA